MANFSALKSLDVTSGKTVEFKLHQITVNGKSPTLFLASASETNKPYFNALLRRVGKTSRALKSSSVNTGVIKELREEDRALYPEFVIKGWSDLYDMETGEPVPFSKVEATNLIAAIPDWLFDDIRNFAGDLSNFTETIDVEVKAKNSQGG